MLGFVFLSLAVAIPLGIAVLTVRATEARREARARAHSSRLASALVFSLSAVLGVLWVLRGNGSDEWSLGLAIGIFFGFPAIGIAAILAAAGHTFLVGHSKVVATLSGVAIAILTILTTSSLAGIYFPPVRGSSFAAAFATAFVLSLGGIPVLLIGGLAGLLIHLRFHRKRRGAEVS